MRYMQQLENRLRALLKKDDEDAVIKFVKATVLESYRNGQQASKATARKKRGRKRNS